MTTRDRNGTAALWVALCCVWGLNACSDGPSLQPEGGLLLPAQPLGTVNCADSGPCLRRGMFLDWRLTEGVSACAAVEVAIRGTWSVGVDSLDWRDQPRKLPVDSKHRRPWLASDRFAADGWQELLDSANAQSQASGSVAVSARFVGEIGLAAEATLGCDPQWQPVEFTLAPTLQVVQLRVTDGFADALEMLGLPGRGPVVVGRAQSLAQAAFAGFSLRFDTFEAPAIAGFRERVTIAVANRDPNGLGLLGNDNSPGKDDGNLLLDEQLDGFNRRTRRRGEAAHGGVFIGELMVFSRKLHPNSTAADPAFDALFGPFSPQLGGTPASLDEDAGAAVEALAQILAETAVHETGHALGLAAGTDSPHHEDDHPGWRMDRGTHRPFGERAGLEGASVWGPLDSLYLETVLPLK